VASVRLKTGEVSCEKIDSQGRQEVSARAMLLEKANIRLLDGTSVPGIAYSLCLT
jgi:hypothetical protein